MGQILLDRVPVILARSWHRDTCLVRLNVLDTGTLMVALTLWVLAELPESDTPCSLARSNSIAQDAGYNPWVPGKVLYIYR